MNDLLEIFTRVNKEVARNQNPRRGAYEIRAESLAIEAQDLLADGHARDAELLIGLAQVYATLNVSDEMIRFMKTEGITVNDQ